MLGGSGQETTPLSDSSTAWEGGGGCWSRGDPWSWGALVWEEESVGFYLLCTSSPCLLLMSFAGVRKLLSLRKEKIAK